MSEIYAKTRYMFWDNLKGLLIFLVVFAHFLYGLQSTAINKSIVDFIYMFHMPAFVFISGYFGKSENSRSFNSIFKLFLAYTILNLTLMFIKYFETGIIQPFTEPCYSAWYFAALIIWRLTIPYFSKIKHYVLISIILSFLPLFYSVINMNFVLIKVLAFLPFYCAGYALSKEKADRFLNLKGRIKYILLILSLVLAIASGYLTFYFCNITDTDLVPNIFENFTLQALYSSIGIKITAFLAILSLLFSSHEKNIPLLTSFGKSSFAIFLVHRPVTLCLQGGISCLPDILQPVIAFILSLLICILFSRNSVTGVINKFFTKIAAVIVSLFKTKLFGVCTLIVSAIILINNIYFINKDISPRIITNEQKTAVDSSFKVIITGDLILLEDMIKRSKTDNGYDFTEYFKHCKDYISSADLAAGVLEGPVAKNIRPFSNGNFIDKKELFLNYPDEFVSEIKDTGFDILTCANNHILDAYEPGVFATENILNKNNLIYTGLYSSAANKEQNRIKFFEKDGIKFAVLSYTYGINNYDEEEIFNGYLAHITSVLPSPGTKYFSAAKKIIENDFKKAKEYNPDIIIVFPHWGTQFSDVPDRYQKTYEKIFAQNGADIIAGDHTHSTQPVRIKNINGRKVLTIYSPGNFANSYTEHNGDASYLTEIYIDKNDKKIISGSIIPLWATSAINGNYTAIPVYKIMTDNNIKKSLTIYDLNRVNEVLSHITKTAFGKEVKYIEERYNFDENGYFRTEALPLKITPDMQKGIFYNLLGKHDNVCFVGDSLTEGTKNGGIPWFEPVKYLVKGKVYNISKGGATTKFILNKYISKINEAKADLYVIALGTNDVRYRDKNICSMTSEEYINNMLKIKSEIQKANPGSEFIFIAPWTSTDGDINSKPNYETKISINNEYSRALGEMCEKEPGCYYINPNDYINSKFNSAPESKYLLDAIHPNGTDGVKLYSEAVMLYK